MLQNKSQRFFLFAVVIILSGIALVLLGSHKKIFNVGDTSVSLNGESQHGDASTKKVYLHSDSSFTFSIPGDFNYSNLAETQDGGAQAESVIFVGNSASRNFQIHISDYGDNTPLTPQIILKDIPDLLIESPEKIAVGGSQGIVFISGPKDGTLRTREIWFTHNGKLFQISTYKDFDNQMVDILSTWKWQ